MKTYKRIQNFQLKNPYINSIILNEKPNQTVHFELFSSVYFSFLKKLSLVNFFFI
jgi:hypothetical protein